MNILERKELIDSVVKEAKGLKSRREVRSLVRSKIPYASDTKVFGIAESVIIIAKLDLKYE